MPEQGEVSSSPVLEIEAPELLAENINFFDQEPFRSVVQELVNRGLDERIIRNFLTQRSIYDPKPNPAHFRKDGIRALNVLSQRYEVPITDSDLSEEYIEARVILNERLSVYPQLGEYVSKMKSSAYYKTDGTFGMAGPTAKYFPVRTYPAWLVEEDRIKEISKKQRLYGIHEIFPPQGPASSLETARELGKPATNRFWRILRNIENPG